MADEQDGTTDEVDDELDDDLDDDESDGDFDLSGVAPASAFTRRRRATAAGSRRSSVGPTRASRR